MKTRIVVSGALALVIGLSACTSDEGRFLNLTSGEEVDIVRNDEGEMVDRETKKPVLLYVDTKEKDTFYGITGEKVNGNLHVLDNDVYVYEEGDQQVKIDGDEYKILDGDAKIKWDADGSEYKYKDDNLKVKEEDGELKIKRDGYKKKVDEDGDIKIETRDKKIKIDGETGERKVKEQSIFSKAKDKITGNK
ncbi:MAG: hypothetical protein EOO14_27180 [Chitinophagaceae bacterium]|nr:MAG: hypothetical protein EOO14_27180 [Chitinophagaceae bacterium]